MRDHLGRFNSFVTSQDLSDFMANQVKEYWEMADYPTLARFRVLSEIDRYKDMNKRRSRTSATEVKKREVYLQG